MLSIVFLILGIAALCVYFITRKSNEKHSDAKSVPVAPVAPLK